MHFLLPKPAEVNLSVIKPIAEGVLGGLSTRPKRQDKEEARTSMEALEASVFFSGTGVTQGS